MADVAQDVSLIIYDALCRAEGVDDPVTPPGVWAREYADARRGGKIVPTIAAEAIALADQIIAAVRERDGRQEERADG